MVTARPAIPLKPASIPAGAFQTPRAASVAAQIPAEMPHEAKVPIRLPFSESASSTRGKYMTAFRALVPLIPIAEKSFSTPRPSAAV